MILEGVACPKCLTLCLIKDICINEEGLLINSLCLTCGAVVYLAKSHDEVYAPTPVQIVEEDRKFLRALKIKDDI